MLFGLVFVAFSSLAIAHMYQSWGKLNDYGLDNKSHNAMREYLMAILEDNDQF